MDLAETPPSHLHDKLPVQPTFLTPAHLNTNYRHFLLFVDEFSLLSDRDLQPLEDFNKTIIEETAKK